MWSLMLRNEHMLRTFQNRVLSALRYEAFVVCFHNADCMLASTTKGTLGTHKVFHILQLPHCSTTAFDNFYSVIQISIPCWVRSSKFVYCVEEWKLSGTTLNNVVSKIISCYVLGCLVVLWLKFMTLCLDCLSSFVELNYRDKITF
jgi:hypothetical protein